MSPAIADPPLTYTVSPSLMKTSPPEPIQTVLSQEPVTLCVGVATLHLRPSSAPASAVPDPEYHLPSILLLQRSAQEKAFANHWELPGGSVEPHQDADLLAAAARELYEETGLRAATFTHALGSYSWTDTDPATGEVRCRKKDGLPSKWRKFSFVVAVEGVGEDGMAPAVRVDPEEHQRYVWATEGEVRADRVGEVELVWTSEEQKGDVLKAFEVTRQQFVRRQRRDP